MAQPSVAQADLIRIGRTAERSFGLSVGENPWFGGVNARHVTDSWHYRGLAIDVSGPADKMLAFNRWVAHRYGPVLAELFHEPGINLKNGAPTKPIGEHGDHVHVALDPALLHGHQAQYFGNARRGPGGGFQYPMSPAERARYEKIAGQEGLQSGPLDVVPGGHTVTNAAGDLGEKVAEGIAGLFASHAETFMLNVGLVGGGAFLVYYGTALMMGVKQPTKPITAAVLPK